MLIHSGIIICSEKVNKNIKLEDIFLYMQQLRKNVRRHLTPLHLTTLPIAISLLSVELQCIAITLT